MDILEDKIKELLLKDIGIKRFQHSLRVAEIAKELGGEIYEGDLQKKFI